MSRLLLSSLLLCTGLAHGGELPATDAHAPTATVQVPAPADPLANIVRFLHDLGVTALSAAVTYGLLQPLYRRPRR